MTHAVSSQVPGVEDHGKKLINILKDRSSFHQEYLVSINTYLSKEITSLNPSQCKGLVTYMYMPSVIILYTFYTISLSLSLSLSLPLSLPSTCSFPPSVNHWDIGTIYIIALLLILHTVSRRDGDWSIQTCRASEDGFQSWSNDSAVPQRPWSDHWSRGAPQWYLQVLLWRPVDSAQHQGLLSPGRLPNETKDGG